MPIDTAIKWDPTTVAGQAILTEEWTGVSSAEKNSFLEILTSTTNDDTYLSKWTQFECFMAIVIRQGQVIAKPIMLKNFQRFMEGPIFYGPYNWPDRH